MNINDFLFHTSVFNLATVAKKKLSPEEYESHEFKDTFARYNFDRLDLSGFKLDYNSDSVVRANLKPTPRPENEVDNMDKFYGESFSDNSKYFITVSTDFLLIAAKEYATIDADQIFARNPTQDYTFVDKTMEWFYGSGYFSNHGAEYDALKESINNIVSELAQRVRNGEDTSLSSLESKLNIGGTEISVDEFKDMQQKALGVIQFFEPRASFGTDSVPEFAKAGVYNAVAAYVGSTLPKGLAEGFANGFKKLNDEVIKRSLDLENRLPEKDPYLQKRITLLIEYSQKAYNIFSNNVITDSKEAFMADFRSKMNDYTKLVYQYSGTYTSAIDINRYISTVQGHFNSMMNAFA